MLVDGDNQISCLPRSVNLPSLVLIAALSVTGPSTMLPSLKQMNNTILEFSALFTLPLCNVQLNAVQLGGALFFAPNTKIADFWALIE